MFDALPFGLTYAIFFAGAVVRANVTYGLGRAARAGGESNERAARRLARPSVRRAETVLARFGAPVVALSFLTVGVQTAVNLAAGVLRMPLVRYEVAVAVGALAWAGIYTTIGFSVLGAWVGQAPWWAWLVAGAGVLLVVWATRWASGRLARMVPYAEGGSQPSAAEDGPGSPDGSVRR